MSEIFSSPTGRMLRPDFLRALLLALLVALVWCTVYDRWTAESWTTPITYLSDPAKGDILIHLAWIEAARDGHISPFYFNNVPELGAPHIANWDDFPLTEKPLIILTGWLARLIGLFAAANAALLLVQIFAAVGFYAAARWWGGTWLWAFAGGMIFAFSRYEFGEGLHHITITSCWHVPLGLVVAAWMMREGPMPFGSRRFWFALAVAAVTGVQNVYYTNLFTQFVLIGGLLQGWRHGWRAALPALTIILTAAGAFLLINANTLAYTAVYGGNDEAVVRAYKWLEIYGLKLVDLVMPPPDHSLPPLADWGAGYLKQTVLSPGEQPPTAYLGWAGLAATAWLVVVSLRRTVIGVRMPLEAYLVLWVILYAGVGGLNGIIGTLGFELFRATTRYSIVVLCIVLLFAVRQLSLIKVRHQAWLYGAAMLGVLIAIWDQTPPFVTDDDIKATAQAVTSDRDFTAQMEARLPAQAMVYQIPIMDFPESPALGLSPYEHLRPYLYAHQLRFSFGSDKGRPQEQWQQLIAQLTPGAAVAQLESYGFSALYLNLNGFTDKGAALIKTLKDMGRSDMFTSERGDLLCVILKPSATPMKPDGY
jgi:phosphoglycerol transferase